MTGRRLPSAYRGPLMRVRLHDGRELDVYSNDPDIKVPQGAVRTADLFSLSQGRDVLVLLVHHKRVTATQRRLQRMRARLAICDKLVAIIGALFEPDTATVTFAVAGWLDELVHGGIDRDVLEEVAKEVAHAVGSLSRVGKP